MLNEGEFWVLTHLAYQSYVLAGMYFIVFLRLGSWAIWKWAGEPHMHLLFKNNKIGGLGTSKWPITSLLSFQNDIINNAMSKKVVSCFELFSKNSNLKIVSM